MTPAPWGPVFSQCSESAPHGTHFVVWTMQNRLFLSQKEKPFATEILGFFKKDSTLRVLIEPHP